MLASCARACNALDVISEARISCRAWAWALSLDSEQETGNYSRAIDAYLSVHSPGRGVPTFGRLPSDPHFAPGKVSETASSEPDRLEEAHGS